MIWITGFALLTALLTALRLISRRGLVLPIIAALTVATWIAAYDERRPVQGLRPTLDMPQLLSATELKADRNGHYITEADINGTAILVMVDTGATGVALSYEDAEKAGLRPRGLDFDIPINTANGVVKAARVTLRRVEVDNVRVRDVDGLVLPEGAMRGSLLGMSFLGRLSSFKIENGVLYLRD
ncbi:MAG: retropepsin-like aspartic protease family protein [Pseudomonadota bacterium]